MGQVRNSIKQPVSAILEAAELLSVAVDAHTIGDHLLADQKFRAADLDSVWNWTNPAWSQPDSHVRVKHPPGDSQTVFKQNRDPIKAVSTEMKAALLSRDGYRCRYCGIPVVDAEIRKIAHDLYPVAVRWDGLHPRGQHAAFQCLWLQFDHVVPHSHGGPTTLDNLVVSCAVCNFAKDRFTLKQLEVADPRLRDPVAISWDGLEKLRPFKLKIVK